jgi:hypothetical protein
MEDITVSRFLYVLKLENDKYYIGSTYNLNFRYAQHCQGRGAKWTKLNKPIGIIEVITNIQTTENELTLQYIDKYGKPNVRGGSFCQV